MIKLERTSVMNMDNAIRGARNPMNSWDKGDASAKLVKLVTDIMDGNHKKK